MLHILRTPSLHGQRLPMLLPRCDRRAEGGRFHQTAQLSCAATPACQLQHFKRPSSREKLCQEGPKLKLCRGLWRNRCRDAGELGDRDRQVTLSQALPKFPGSFPMALFQKKDLLDHEQHTFLAFSPGRSFWWCMRDVQALKPELTLGFWPIQGGGPRSGASHTAMERPRKGACRSIELLEPYKLLGCAAPHATK